MGKFTGSGFWASTSQKSTHASGKRSVIGVGGGLANIFNARPFFFFLCGPCVPWGAGPQYGNPWHCATLIYFKQCVECDCTVRLGSAPCAGKCSKLLFSPGKNHIFLKIEKVQKMNFFDRFVFLLALPSGDLSKSVNCCCELKAISFRLFRDRLRVRGSACCFLLAQGSSPIDGSARGVPNANQKVISTILRNWSMTDEQWLINDWWSFNDQWARISDWPMTDPSSQINEWASDSMTWWSFANYQCPMISDWSLTDPASIANDWRPVIDQWLVLLQWSMADGQRLGNDWGCSINGQCLVTSDRPMTDAHSPMTNAS